MLQEQSELSQADAYRCYETLIVRQDNFDERL